MIEFIIYLCVVIFSAAFFITAIGCVRAIFSGHIWNRLGLTFGWFIGTDNRRWVTLLGLSLIVSGIAVTHPGDGLSKPSMDRFRATPEVRSLHEIDEKYDNLTRFGRMATNAELCAQDGFEADICEDESQEYKSWVWWKLAVFFWLATIIYFFPAFWDDAREFIGRVYNRLAESPEGEARLRENWFGRLLQTISNRRGGRRTPPPGGAGTTPGGTGESPTGGGSNYTTGRIFFREFLAALVPELLVEWRSIFGRR